MNAECKVLRWDDLPVDSPMPKLQRRRIIGSHAMISRVVLTKGFVLASHSHANEQMACVISGRIRFVLHEGTNAEQSLTLVAGEVLVLPPHALHSAEALEDTEVWDIFNPPSATTGVDRPGK